jgi:VCBS repeat-containing protein
VTLAVNNVNDNAPNIVDASATLDENVDPGTFITNVSDSFTGTDFDRDGDAITYSITGGNGGGIFEINSSTGVITIAAGKTLNYEAASVHNLTVTATDGTLSDTAAVTVNVNDLIVEAVDDVGSVEETATLSVNAASGVLINDIGTSKSVSAVNGVSGNIGSAVLGAYGSLTLNADGSYTYVANANSLAEGETVDDVFTYVTSGVGGSDTGALTITLTGTNDLPVFGGVDTGAVAEDVAVVSGMLSTTGTLTVTDPDSGESLIDTLVPVISSGNLGALVINASGAWTYTVDNAAVQYLAEGQTRAEVFTVTSMDGSTHDITVTITGDQDNPTAQNATIPIPKNATHVLTADDFGITDADSSDSLTVMITSTPVQGLLKYYDGSAWVDVAANDTIPYTDIENGLLVYVPATNDTGNESFTYTVTDGTYTTAGNTVTFSINIELTVSSPLPVDEGKATVFAIELSDVRLADDTVLTLALGGEATGDDYVAPMQYRIQNADGSYTAWQDVSGSQITIVAGQTRAEVKVKTVVNDDGLGVTSESLTLTATTTAAADLANTSATGATSINDLPSLLLSGASYVSEGGITTFDLELSNVKATDTVVTLSFEGVATLGVDFDYSIDGGTTWISTATSAITLTGSALSNPSFEIQVRTLTDAAIESDEVLRLVAVTADTGIANSGSQVMASTLIVDPIIVTTSEDAAVTILSGTSYEYAVLGQAGHGTVTNSGGDIIYVPDANWSGTDSFTITKTNEVGLSVTSVVTVNVTAVADAPIVTIDVLGPYNNPSSSTNYITNGSFETYSGGTGTNPRVLPSGTSNTANLTGWSYTTGGGNALELYTNQVSGITGTRVLDTSESGKKSTDLTQTITGLTVGTTYELKLDLAIPAGSTGALSIVWNGQTLQSVSQASLTSTLTTFTFRVVASATNTLLLDAENTADSGGGDNTGVFIDNVRLTAPDTYTYTVNVAANLVDSDGSESLTNSFVITGTGLPPDAILSTSTGTLLTRSGTGPYTWTVTSEADLTGLQLTMVKPIVGTGNFTLSATATSTEVSNGDIETGSALTAAINMPTNGSGTANLLPVIGNSDITLSNEANFVGTVTETISTQFGDGTNTFSWTSTVDSLPNIYVAGELVQYVMTVSPDGLTGTITGTIAGGTEVFELVIQLNPGADADVSYTQLMSLGTEVVSTVESLPLSGGNGQDLLLTFTAGSTTFNAVVTGENYLDGTTTTLNTSSKYLGAANNLMNPGERVTMDFASGTTGNAVSTMQISLFNFDSASNSAPDELTITGTTVDGSTFVYYITNASLDANSAYTIAAPGGALIETLVFESGSQSSFKLGIESVSAVEYDVNFDLQLGYQLTDADGDSATGTISLTLDGDNTIIGTAGDDVLLGGSSADVIAGGAGNDDISGGAGNDTLTGGLGSDVFRWSLADAGLAGSPAIDSITDFDTSAGTDKLDLRDLLTGESHTAASLDNYLHFEVTGGNTIVHISSSGGFGGNGVVNAVVSGSATETQQIVLVAVDLSVGGLTTDQQIIQSLINNQKLITD